MSGASSPLSPSTHSSSLRSRAIISIVTLILITVPSSTLAQGGGAIKLLDVDLPFGGSNPCTEEPFAGTQRIMVILYSRVDGSTGAHHTFRTIVHSQATSLGLNPRKYQANSESGTQLNEPSSGSAEVTETVNQVLVRQGEQQSSLALANEDDFMLKRTFHVTMNANGIITAQVDNGHETTCAGPPVGPAVIIVP